MLHLDAGRGCFFGLRGRAAGSYRIGLAFLTGPTVARYLQYARRAQMRHRQPPAAFLHLDVVASAAKQSRRWLLGPRYRRDRARGVRQWLWGDEPKESPPVFLLRFHRRPSTIAAKG